MTNLHPVHQKHKDAHTTPKWPLASHARIPNERGEQESSRVCKSAGHVQSYTMYSAKHPSRSYQFVTFLQNLPDARLPRWGESPSLDGSVTLGLISPRRVSWLMMLCAHRHRHRLLLPVTLALLSFCVSVFQSVCLFFIPSLVDCYR